MSANYSELEKKLWEAADNLRANSSLKPSEYSVPVLGLIFLRYADFKFGRVEKELALRKRGRGGKWQPYHERKDRAAVRLIIDRVLDRHLAAIYTDDLYELKCQELYQHLYENYGEVA